MKTINFSVGEIVSVKGLKGRFRYVKGNVVRSIKTGRVQSVKYEQIRKPVDYSMAFGTFCILASGLALAGYTLFKLFNYFR